MEKLKMLAHLRGTPETPQEQTLAAHSRNSADYAAECLTSIGLEKTAYLAGLLHDMGKAKREFVDYLWRVFLGENVERGSVNHTFAAVRFLLERYHDAEDYGLYGCLTAEVLAYAVGSHHGLFDGVDEKHCSGLMHRLRKENTGYEEAKANFLEQCADLKELDDLFQNSVTEIEMFLCRGVVPLLENGAEGEDAFYLGLLVRLVASAVVAGDRRDTAEFMDCSVFPQQKASTEISAFWERLLTRVEEKLNKFPQERPIQTARQAISLQCRRAASRPTGIYRLNVPTGAGKTLSALRFALAHNQFHQKNRIIFTSPLLSILEQNAAVIREFIGDDAVILEHHSNVVRPEENREELDAAELLTETWDHTGIIITTLVQLLNTMFMGKAGCIRRFHALCNCTIVIDEVQTVPSHLLSLFHLAISFLAGACHATIVLCSATQPCAEAASHPIRLETVDLVPYDGELWKIFQRTKIGSAGTWPVADMPELLVRALQDTNSLLVVCNKKKQAEAIFTSFSKGQCRKFYLSASMCAAHRTDTLAALRQALKHPEEGKVLCVSTQVIEAGVDISFERVIRLTAGMDSIVQAAGRCNRNRECEGLAPVWIVQCAGENLSKLPEIQRGKEATQQLLREFQKNPALFQGELASDAAIRYYYKCLYRNMPNGLQEGPVKIDAKRTSLYHLLSTNEDLADEAYCDEFMRFSLNQAFRTAGKLFSVFDREGTDVLVPYSEGKNAILSLGGLQLPGDLKEMQRLLQEAKPFTVSTFAWQRDRLEAQGALLPLCGGRVFALQEQFYDEEIGLTDQSGNQAFLEV